MKVYYDKAWLDDGPFEAAIPDEVTVEEINIIPTGPCGESVILAGPKGCKEKADLNKLDDEFGERVEVEDENAVYDI